jgi:dTDP-D-glucose 4,6-dehydratase
MICEVMNKNFDEVVEYVEDRPSQDPSYNSVSTKLRSLGWVPKRTLEGQLPAIVEWTKNNREFFNE